MNKKLLATAIGAALAAGPMWAQAQVKVGGHAQVEYYNTETDTTGAAKLKGSGLIDNARGRVWITASEDLAGGMKALAHLEFNVDIANSGQSEANGNASTAFDPVVRGFDSRQREKYVGLSGGFGAFKIGNNHGAYKRMGGVRWDPFNATVLEARGNGGQSGTDVSASNFTHNGFIPGSIKWESGKLFGDMVYAEVLYAPEETTGATGDTGRGNDMQAAISFKPMSGLEIIAALSSNAKQPSAAANQDQDGTKLGARWSVGPHTVWYQREEIDVNSDFTAPSSLGITTAAVGDAEYNWLGYSLKFGNHTFVAQLGDGDMKASGVATREHEYRNLAVIHSLSKTTSAWAGMRNTERKTSATKTEQDVWSLGLRVNF